MAKAMSQRQRRSSSMKAKSGTSSSNSRLSFAELIDMLEPEGSFPETEASAWKSIIDRNEQLIVFYQVDYVQASPNISKCVRIRRHRSDTNVDKLVPTVFVNQQLQSTYVKDLLGRKHLVSHGDLTSILDHLQLEKGRGGFTVNGGLGSDGDDDDDSDDEEDIPAHKSSLQIPLILPSSLASGASTYLPGFEEEDGTNAELEYRILPPKWGEDGQEEVLSETPPEDSGSEEYRPPSKKAKKSPSAGARNFFAESEATYSSDVQQNSNITAALKLLPCSTPGPGKVPLIRPPYAGTQLYVCGVKFRLLLESDIRDKKKYFRALFRLLTGESGVDDLAKLREEHMQRNNVDQFGPCTLLGTDFLDTVKCHLHEQGFRDTGFLTTVLNCIFHDKRRIRGGSRKKAVQSASS